MFDEYDDYYREPSEADKIIQTALADLKELFTNEVKSTIEEAKEAKKKLEETQRELRGVEFKLRRTEEQLAVMQEKLEKADLYDVPRQYIARFVRNATGDYAPGDTVWVHTHEYDQVECPVCKGKEEVNAILGGYEKKIRCPECSGYGFKRESRVVIKKETISEIRLKLCFREGRVNYWNTESVYVGSREYSVDPKYIFRTEEAAQAALQGGAVHEEV